ncbi:MAG TPA: hypothetical protein VKV26_18810 [Dehalococcoidia bacterium]|nr:hypothetical protein [Dehalococcoidia bacterium]
MNDSDIRTYPLSLTEEANGITVSIPWAQRQANGAVIVRVHAQAPRHTAGELLLNESDLIALDPDERPLRTQVRRFWGYSTLEEVTPAHMQTARFDVGFRLDLASSGGHCGLSIALLRSFRPGEGPRAVGGPWAFRFRVADDAEVAAAAQAEGARIEAARLEAARAEAARQESGRLDAERREATRQERARIEAARAERLASLRGEAEAVPAEAAARFPRPPDDRYEANGGRRPGRFLRPEQVAGTEEEAPTYDEPPQPPAATVSEAAEFAPQIVEAAVMGAEPELPRRPSRRGRAARPASGGDESAEGAPAPARRAPRRRGSGSQPAEPVE